MQAGIGHNNPPFDFFEFFDIVTGTSATIAEKFIAIVHARQIARKNGESYLSRAKAQTAASVSDNTYQRAMPVVRLMLEDTRSRGRATTWKARPDITTDSIEEAILAMRDTPKACPKSMPQNGVYTKKDAPEGGMGMPQNGAAPYPNLVGHKDQSKDQFKDSHSQRARATEPVLKFDGRAIQLDHALFDRWQGFYPKLDLMAELPATDAFVMDAFSASFIQPDSHKRELKAHQYLAKRNRQHEADREAAKQSRSPDNTSRQNQQGKPQTWQEKQDNAYDVIFGRK